MDRGLRYECLFIVGVDGLRTQLLDVEGSLRCIVLAACVHFHSNQFGIPVFKVVVVIIACEVTEYQHSAAPTVLILSTLYLYLPVQVANCTPGIQCSIIV